MSGGLNENEGLQKYRLLQSWKCSKCQIIMTLFYGAKMKVCCYAEPMEKGLFLHYPSKAVKAEIEHLYQGVKDKYNGYMTVTLDKPYKSRSNEQNRMFWGIVQQIATETGNDLDDIEEAVKERALKRGYPATANKLTGRPKPLSMTKVNTVEMSYLIDTAYEVCAFLGIVLEPELKKEEAPKIKDTYANEYDIF